MARDTRIIRPDRPTRQNKAETQEVFREERMRLLAQKVVQDVIKAIEAKRPPPRKTPGKR